MSTQNLDIIKGTYEAFGRGDIPFVLAGLTPDAEWTEAEGFPYGGTYHGPNAVLEGVFMRMSFKAPFVHVWKLRDGKAFKFNQHTDTLVVHHALQP